MNQGTLPANLDKITRLTVVDDTGRVYEQWELNVTASVQDEGRTLKLFVTKKGQHKLGVQGVGPFNVSENLEGSDPWHK